MSNGDKHKNKHSINILGQNLTVTGEISKKQVNQLADYINKIGNEIKEAYPHLPFRRLAGLTLVNLAHKYYEAYTQNQKLLNENKNLKKENKQLLEKIEKLEKEYEELSVLLEEVDG
ncbi:MAG: cell division protein ZapA [Halanaerobiales bacterium]